MRAILCGAVLWVGTLALAGPGAASQPPAKKALPTADAVLKKMDADLTSASRKVKLKMTVKGRRTRTFEMIAYGRGEEDAAVEYLSPAREKRTKMLKLGDALWIYLPTVERVQKIAGHMLRQGMMGSDVSYEDLMTSRKMLNRYTAKVTGEGAVDGRACWKLELTAKDDAVTYPKRVMCVDEQTGIPLEQKLYALSGMLLKTWSMSGMKQFPNGRWFPTHMEIRDEVKKDSVTVLDFEDLQFGVRFPAEVFSLRWLERE